VKLNEQPWSQIIITGWDIPREVRFATANLQVLLDLHILLFRVHWNHLELSNLSVCRKKYLRQAPQLEVAITMAVICRDSNLVLYIILILYIKSMGLWTFIDRIDF
jgi:hypothetical protein